MTVGRRQGRGRVRGERVREIRRGRTRKGWRRLGRVRRDRRRRARVITAEQFQLLGHELKLLLENSLHPLKVGRGDSLVDARLWRGGGGCARRRRGLDGGRPGRGDFRRGRKRLGRLRPRFFRRQLRVEVRRQRFNRVELFHQEPKRNCHPELVLNRLTGLKQRK